MNLVLILVVIVVVLVGCEGYKKLTGTSSSHQAPAQAATNQTLVVKGHLHGQNFVEVPSNHIDYIEFLSDHGTKYIDIPPYSKELDEAKEPYYLVSDTSVLFFNLTSGSYRIYLQD